MITGSPPPPSPPSPSTSATSRARTTRHRTAWVREGLLSVRYRFMFYSIYRWALRAHGARERRREADLSLAKAGLYSPARRYLSRWGTFESSFLQRSLQGHE